MDAPPPNPDPIIDHPPTPRTDNTPTPPQPETSPPRPHPLPAYLPTTTSSPLLVDKSLYTSIRLATRAPHHSTTLPPRSGLSLPLPAKSILRITTPKGPQVVDLNVFSLLNPREHFWASRTRQLHSSHLTTYDRLWSNIPYMRPMLTIIADSLVDRGVGTSEFGGRAHDLLGTRCDPYINHLLTSTGSSGGEDYNYHCHSNLTRAILPYGLAETDVHDVLNLFQVTGLDPQGRYFMEACPAKEGDYIEFFVEQEVLVALSTCPGGDLSLWGFGPEGEERMRECCREVRVEVFKLVDEEAVLGGKWKEPMSPAYRGMHGMRVPTGEGVEQGGVGRREG